MGRTARCRRRRRISCCDRPIISCQFDFVALITWMKSQGWKPTCRLTPACFSDTGRGLLAAQNINVGQSLAAVPGHLVITVDLVSMSSIGKFFNTVYKTQQVLATYLMFENHKGSESFWYNYINSLPKIISNAAYCSTDNLPDDLIEKVVEHQNYIFNTFKQITMEMSTITCSHCSKSFKSIFTFELYKWAWSIVNTRAVYVSPDCSVNNNIKLSDTNNLALVPYIDMFNHSPSACVRATMSQLNGKYTIVTDTFFSKHSEVFINYGPHSNTKLFLEYGFIIPSNPQDSVNLSSKEIITKTGRSLVKHRMEKLRSFNLLDGHNCTSEGISWSTRVLIYILIYSDRMNDEELKNRVFSNLFDQNEIDCVSKIGAKIIETKLEETIRWENNMSLILKKMGVNKCFSYTVALKLVKENRRLLEKCLQSLYLQ